MDSSPNTKSLFDLSLAFKTRTQQPIENASSKSLAFGRDEALSAPLGAHKSIEAPGASTVSRNAFLPRKANSVPKAWQPRAPRRPERVAEPQPIDSVSRAPGPCCWDVKRGVCVVLIKPGRRWQVSPGRACFLWRQRQRLRRDPKAERCGPRLPGPQGRQTASALVRAPPERPRAHFPLGCVPAEL